MGLGYLEMELAKKVDFSSFVELKKELNLIKEELQELKKQGINGVQKVLYSIQDLSKIMHLEANTIRKNYIKTGIVDAYIPDGSKNYVIEAKEFHRIKDIIGKYGINYLRSLNNGES